MPTPERVFARLLICVCAVAGSLVIAGALLLLVSDVSSIRALRAHWCVAAPASVVDWVLHSPAFGTWLLLLPPALIVGRVVRDEQAMRTELRARLRQARLPILSPGVAIPARRTGTADRLDVVEAAPPFAFVYGWVRPRICISTGLVARLDERELEAVLRHEQWHVARRDPMRLVVVRMLAAAFLFLPPISLMVRQYRLAIEIAADRHAVTAMGSRRWLASALAKLMTGEAPLHPVAFVGLAESRIAVLAGDAPSETIRHHRIAAWVLIGELAIAGSAIVQRGGWLNPFC